MTGPVPSDYDAEDGTGDGSLEQCPHCEKTLGAEHGHHGTVFDSRGREYDHLLDTDPAQGPFFCPDCWPELDANRRASENRTLGGWT